LATTLVTASFVAAAEPKMQVHEWGTFTALQDETGEPIAGVNSQEEPLPRFTHDLALMLIIGNPVQGAPKCHPDVTMRLETPVIYFHLPESAVRPVLVDVRVWFKGGWLTQFYPKADADAPGLHDGTVFGKLTGETVSSLRWYGLRVGGQGVGPDTGDHVWLVPRSVRAESVTTASGEVERFLFYRGVGHIRSPLRFRRDASGTKFVIAADIEPAVAQGPAMSIPEVWLVDIRENGTAAFRTLGPFALTPASATPQAPPPQAPSPQAQPPLAETPASFSENEYRLDGVADLGRHMHRSLTTAGLFEDEAKALLDTWELSYFKSPGLRAFFLVPPDWTNHYLPLKLSIEAEIKRVMVGRVELVTPELRARARECAALSSQRDRPESPVEKRYQELYQKLGRFRDALILDEQARNAPSP
jgi:hypothetical protein